jgi:Xaa-Pro aminopeptidase
MMDDSFFSGNRKRLIDSLNGGIAVFSAYTKMQGSSDTATSFEQEANFWWLSGVSAPGWWLIMDGLSGKSWLVAPEITDSHELFDGSLSPEQALDISGADGVYKHDEATERLRGLAKKHPLVYTLGEPSYARYVDFTLNPAPKKLRGLLERTFTTVQDCRKELARLRAIKQQAELTAIAKAATLTVETFAEVKESLASCRYEYEAEAELTYRFRRRGSTHAFEPIVASGKNACTLHYIENSGVIGKQHLVLIDAGARLHGYPADITRTYAMGDPTKRQAAVHKAVQDAERQIIALLGPELKIEDYGRSADRIMKDALISLGLMRSHEDDKNYRRYFPHAISHGLGVDVHDSLGGWKYLQPGMVLTVEPGIYIPEEGIGVRIEDDVVITADGRRNLSHRLSTDL